MKSLIIRIVLTLIISIICFIFSCSEKICSNKDNVLDTIYLFDTIWVDSTVWDTLDTIIVDSIITDTLIINTSLLSDFTLLGLYHFSNGAYDSSGYNNHGEVYGTSEASDYQGNLNQTIEFISEEDYIEFPSSLSLHGQSEFTIALKANLNPTPNNNILFFESTSSATAARVALSILPQGEIKLGWRDYYHDNSPNKYTMQSTTSVPFKQWIDIVVVWDAVNQQQSFYLNGNIIHQDSIETSNLGYSKTSTIRTGRIPTSTLNYCSGIIDELRIYNRALTSSEVLGLFFQK